MKKLFILLAVVLLAGCSVSAPSVSVGKEGIINSGGELTAVAVSEKVFDEWVSASVANDKEGKALLLLSGKMFVVKSGTRALVIDQSVGARKVRIIDGKNKGMAGWIAMEYIK